MAKQKGKMIIFSLFRIGKWGGMVGVDSRLIHIRKHPLKAHNIKKRKASFIL